MPNLIHASTPLVLALLCAVSSDAAGAAGGIVFACAPQQSLQLRRAMTAYLRELGVERQLVTQTGTADGTLGYTLNSAADGTLELQRQYRIPDESLRLPLKNGKTRAVRTVAKKEILLALLQPGRLTRLHGAACTVAALREQVGLRQNIVAWSEELSWVWPDGELAYWNRQMWDRGTPLATVPLRRALLDAFLHQDRYRIGCYTAAKLVYAHAVLDYYVRVRKDSPKTALVRSRLLHDAEPLVGVEPPAMWDFESDFDAATRDVPGKLLRLNSGVAAGNFVPGDWVYLRNTDPLSAQKTGYEGSNAIYLGRGRFSDYYNDHRHSYTYAEKVDEVYQWRHGVFSRSRDAAKIVPLSEADIARLSQAPAEGGLLLDLRAIPYWFGYEDLPQLPPPRQLLTQSSAASD
ncbi:MAG: hypothetical protein HYZ65_02145 [Burkholderiales bacterium]|nr:hypothetical protein [Burkholderiales bacterium]